MLNFPINCLAPQPPLHLAQQAVPVQQRLAGQTLGFDRPAARCVGRAVLGLKAVYRSRLSGLTALSRENCPFSLCLALTSPSFLCAKAGEGCVWGSRRSRAEPGSQEC